MGFYTLGLLVFVWIVIAHYWMYRSNVTSRLLQTKHELLVNAEYEVDRLKAKIIKNNRHTVVTDKE